MIFSNNKVSYDEFFTENSRVLDKIYKRLNKHAEYLNRFFDKTMYDVRKKELGSKWTNEPKGVDDIRGEEEFLYRLAIPSDEVAEILKTKLTESFLERDSVDKTLHIERYCSLPSFVDIDVFGDISKTGSFARSTLKDEMESKYYMNTILKRKVFDIDKLVYVSFFYDSFELGNQARAVDTPLNFSDRRSYIVELDATIVRYATTLNEEELCKFMDSICVLVTDKVCRLIASENTYIKLVKQYVKYFITERSEETHKTPKVNPKAIFMALLVAKVYCDGINGLTTNNDTKTMDSIVNLADISIRNSGSLYGLGKASALLFSSLNRSRVRGRYLERYMDMVVEFVEQHKGDMVSSLNRSGKFSFNINPRTLHRNINELKYAAFECEAPSLEYIYQYSDMIMKFEDQNAGMFSIIGMEADDGKFDAYKRKTRAELLKMLTDKERSSYTKLESEITRYRSDSINAKDATRKNALFIRSRGLGKIIALEIGKTKNEFYIDLLTSLDEARYDIDTTLSKRDFNREKNTRMYGQIIPSGDWDY